MEVIIACAPSALLGRVLERHVGSVHKRYEAKE